MLQDTETYIVAGATVDEMQLGCAGFLKLGHAAIDRRSLNKYQYWDIAIVSDTSEEILHTYTLE